MKVISISNKQMSNNNNNNNEVIIPREVLGNSRMGPLVQKRPLVPIREVINQLRTGTKEEMKLIGILKNEEEFLKTKTTELNSLLSSVFLPHGHWDAIKWEKRKIRKKINKRVSDDRKKMCHLECEREVAECRDERDRLREERDRLQREVWYYENQMKMQYFNC